MSSLWSVAVDAPIAEALTYQSPLSGSRLIQRGQLVKVPLGRRQAIGVVLGPCEIPPAQETKPITQIEEQYPLLPDHFLKWLQWMAQYYSYPIGSVVSLAYPPLEKQLKERKSSRPAVIPHKEAKPAPALTVEQAQVISEIQAHVGFSTHLLFGVTGSGKTEVYLRLLQDTLAAGKQGIVLVPEISLTPQLIHRFAERFGDQIAVLHSQLTDRERTTQWWNMIEGKKRILIGARSALFCPLSNPGLIIVDEEHEPSFKQDEKLKYNGRDCAVTLGKFSNCPVLLGSATPCLETWKNALDGRYHLHRMVNRVQNRALPNVEIVDLRKAEKNPALPFWLSDRLFTSLSLTLEKQKQAALFLNRRGMAQVVLCSGCGYTYECPNCDITLTLHGQSHLVCHYCDYHEHMKLACPSCKEGEVKPVGLGTELIENDIRSLFPQARIARADRDEIQTRQEMEELIENMEMGEIDILIGTQMIAKGLDFPKLQLVGLCLADVGFNLPDFRSTERSFQLITQVAGRAGRHIRPGEDPGEVIIQTFNTDHPSLSFALHHDFEGFAKYELDQRQGLSYPPFGKLVSFRIQGTQNDRVFKASQLLAKRCQALKEKSAEHQSIEILGPAEAPIAKLRGQFRYHLLLKSAHGRPLSRFCYLVLGNQKWLPPGVRIVVDVDPLHLL